MDDLTKRALESVLFSDADTPEEALIERYAADPIDLDGEESAALVGQGKLFTLWPENDGACALLSADLHSFIRDAGLPHENLVLRLPRSVDGVSLKRVSAGAFRSWLSYGASIRLLMLPEGLTEIADEALSPLCFEHCFIPSTLERFGSHHVRWNKMTCYPKRIRYTVSRDSEHFSSSNGSLFSKDGTYLIAQAFPYGEAPEIAQNVTAIRADSFMHTPQPPHCIMCPGSLEHIDDIVDENAVWACGTESELGKCIRAKGGYAAEANVREIDGGLYDADAVEARLVQRRPEARGFAIEESIDGLPLARIGERAIRNAEETLALPRFVRSIDDGNTCPELRKLVLNEGLERIGSRCFVSMRSEKPVHIPHSVCEIGNGSFGGAFITFEALQTTVVVPGFSHELFTPHSYTLDQDGCFAAAEASDGKAAQTVVPFDMEAYDALLCSGRMIRMKKTAVAYRLEGKVAISEERAHILATQLLHDADFAMEFAAASQNARHIVKRLAEAGFYNEKRFGLQCDMLRDRRKSEALNTLMRWKAACVAPKNSRPSTRFAF